MVNCCKISDTNICYGRMFYYIQYLHIKKNKRKRMKMAFISSYLFSNVTFVVFFSFFLSAYHLLRSLYVYSSFKHDTLDIFIHILIYIYILLYMFCIYIKVKYNTRMNKIFTIITFDRKTVKSYVDVFILYTSIYDIPLPSSIFA